MELGVFSTPCHALLICGTWVEVCVGLLASLNAANTESGLKAGNACYRSVLNVLSSVYENLSSSLLSKNMKIEINRSGILPVVFYGCETWSLT